MSEEQWKLVPVEPTEEMLNVLHDRVLISVDSRKREANILNDKAWWSAVVSAAPQPPALGGALNPLAYIAFAGNGNIRCWSRELGDRTLAALKEDGQHIVELVDRTHVARLQAEVERLKTDSRKLAELDDSTIKQLGDRLRVSEARTAELEGLLRDAYASGMFPNAEIAQRIDAALAEGAKS